MNRRQLLRAGLALPAALLVGGAAEARTYTFRKPAAEALRAPGAGPAAQTPPDPGPHPADFLLHAEGPAGGTGFVDSAGNAIFNGTNGFVSYSDAQARFGQTSLLLDNGAIRFRNMPLLNSLDFTVDLWAYFGPNQNPNPSALLSTASGYSDWGFVFRTNVSYAGQDYDLSARIETGGFAFADSQVNVVSLPRGQWLHLAAVRHQGKLGLAINGVFQEWVTLPALPDLNYSYMKLGGAEASVDLATRRMRDTYLEEVRITKAAQWTADFTPPNAPYA